MTDADEFFRAKAIELGYLEEDAHEPGNGRGLWAFYRDSGMIPPGQERVIAEHEVTGLLEDRDPAVYGRRTGQVVE